MGITEVGLEFVIFTAEHRRRAAALAGRSHRATVGLNAAAFADGVVVGRVRETFRDPEMDCVDTIIEKERI